MQTAFKAIKRSLMVSLGVLCFYASNSALADEEVDPRAEKLNELRQAIDQLKGELDGVKGSRDTLLDDLEKSESKIGELNKKAKKLEHKIDKNQAQLIELKGEKEALASVKKQQQRQVSEQLNTAYRLGQQSHLKLMLNQRDASLVARNLKYFDYIAAARAEQIAAANHTLERIGKIEPEIAANQKSLVNNSKSLRKQQKAMRAQHKERKETLKKLQATILTKDQELQANEKNQKRLKNLIERVVRVSGDLENPVKAQNINTLKGKLPWPVKGPVRHSYNSQRISGKMRWKGMVIGAPSDAPVKAVHHGRVVFSDYLRGHGLLVIVDHGHGMLSLYAHNKTLYKALGEWVNAGEIIASVGNTGGQVKAGLYFELRHKGSPTNPHRWLKKSA